MAETYNRAIDGIKIGPAVGSCGTAAYKNEMVTWSDLVRKREKLEADLRGLKA